MSSSSESPSSKRPTWSLEHSARPRCEPRNVLRGCFEQDRFTWKVLWQAFPGFQRVLQAIQWHHNKTTKNCRATHFHKCCLRAVFTTKDFVQHLSYSLIFNVSGCIWYIFFDVSFSKLIAPLLSHFPNISNKIPYNSSNFTPKEETRLQKAANSWKSGLKKRGKLQFLQESPQESCSFCKSDSDLTLRAA